MSIEARLSRFTEIATRLDESVALLAAFELGVFDALRMGPLLSAELAARCGAAERRLRAILDVVVCLGYLERHDGHYSLVDGDEALFEPGSPWLQSMHFMDLRGFLEGRGRILDVLRSDEPLPVAGTGGPASPEERRHFLHFLHHRSQNAAEEVADLLASDEIGTFADLGCGLGTYSIALLKLMPNARAVLVDRRNAEEAISEMVEEEGLADRVTFLPVDFLEADFGQDFDLVLVSNVMHCLSPEENRVLARRAARSLKYGARLAVKDIGVQPDRSGPPSALRFGMNMAISSRGGDVYSEKEVVGWIEEAGLEHEATLQLRSASSAYLVVSTRPPSGAGHTVSLVQVRDAQRHSDRIVILGGGIAGLATSIALRERGFHTDSYERVQAFRGRGLAFIVMPRGLRSIERLGGGASIRRLGAIVDRALIRTRRDEPIVTQTLPECVCVRRSELVFLLRSLLPQDSMHRGMEFTGFRRDRSGEVVGANFEFGDVARGAAFIGADGVRSRVRQALFPDHRLNEVRVVELVSMVRAPELAEALGTTFIKTVDDEGGLACGVVPCGFGGVVWYIQFDARKYPLPGKSVVAKRGWARRMVGSWPDPIPQLIDETDFMESHVWRTTDFDALDRLHDGRVALAGDAAHAFLTFTSQGVSAALEDAEALAECFAEHFERDGVAKVFEAYDARRRPGLQKMVDDGRELARRFLYPERYLDGRKLPLVYEPPDDA